MRYVIKSFILSAILLIHTIAWGAHPLITDDAGTQGKGKFQLEVNGEYDSDKETENGLSLESTGSQVATTLSYGVTENADLVLSLPYQWGKGKEDGITVYDEKGISDTTLEVKWRFLEKDGLSLALKPGVTFPTGNDEKGLGASKTGYHLFIIASKEAAPWAFHLNVGYIGNENKVDEEKNIWHASLATTYEVIKNLKLVGNAGIERNPDKAADNDPAFVIGGFIYSLAENFDIDCGVKYGLTGSETDWSLMAGMAFRF
ncbi:MAG: transporter [Deltaproteobacteria bacterium]|nr:transporter [Deltaproteobacteria bacterium]